MTLDKEKTIKALLEAGAERILELDPAARGITVEEIANPEVTEMSSLNNN